VFCEQERLASAGFLAGYSGPTREAYALDLRQYATWCHAHNLRLFAARRADVECSGRDLTPSSGWAGYYRRRGVIPAVRLARR